MEVVDSALIQQMTKHLGGLFPSIRFVSDAAKACFAPSGLVFSILS